MSQTVLILGASGRFGRNAAQAFAARNWSVRRFDRDRDDLMASAQGVDVIVNAWNPLYPRWAAEVPGLHARVQQAARASGATVIVPGNVYVFGAETPGPWGPDTPHLAQNPLGVIRARMERSYRQSGVRTIILRAGDFLDTHPSGNWFDQIIAKRLDKGILTWPGDPDALHAWAFLPDLARAAVALAERRHELPVFTDVPFAGYTISGADMARTLGGVRIRQMSWLPLQLLRPVWPLARHLIEMRYLWNTPHRLDSTSFDTLLPGFEQTDLADALRAATAHISVDTQINPDQPVAAGS